MDVAANYDRVMLSAYDDRYIIRVNIEKLRREFLIKWRENLLEEGGRMSWSFGDVTLRN